MLTVDTYNGFLLQKAVYVFISYNHQKRESTLKAQSVVKQGVSHSQTVNNVKLQLTVIEAAKSLSLQYIKEGVFLHHMFNEVLSRLSHIILWCLCDCNVSLLQNASF